MPLIKSRMVTSAEGVDFLCNLSPLLCAEELTTSSAEHRTGASLLEGDMTERKYLKHWKRKNKDKIRAYRLRYFKKNPWAKWKCLIASRCACHPLLLRLGIKNKITTQELKQLWFRDKAWLLKRPSIDRKDSQKSYTFANCRFIELLENLKRPKIFTLKAGCKKKVKCFNCGIEFVRYLFRIKTSKRQFCSYKCFDMRRFDVKP